MVAIHNRTAFPAELLSLPDADAQEIPLLLVSATWMHAKDGTWAPAEEQAPICVADEYVSDDPVFSSLKNEAQTATEKPLVDVIVNGSAYAPGGRPTTAVTVELYAGTVAKQVRVFGDRYDAIVGPSWPEKFESMPLIYERAFGGWDTRHTDPARHAVWNLNPSGVGFRGARSHSRQVRTEYPNLEPATGSAEGPPAGFGIISRAWSPRIEHAGTFGAEWLQDQWPLLPRDFDVRHYQAAPVDQQTPSLRTGDPVQLLNFTPDGRWEFPMPETHLPVWLVGENDVREAALRMDTVLIEPDHRRLTLVFRLNLAGLVRQGRVREIVIGLTSPGYLRARLRHKVYLDRTKPKASVEDLTI